MTTYTIDLDDPDEAESLYQFVEHHTPPFSVSVLGTEVHLGRAGFDFLADQPATAPWHISAYGDISKAGTATLWTDDEDSYAVHPSSVTR